MTVTSHFLQCMHICYCNQPSMFSVHAVHRNHVSSLSASPHVYHSSHFTVLITMHAVIIKTFLPFNHVSTCPMCQHAPCVCHPSGGLWNCSGYRDYMHFHTSLVSQQPCPLPTRGSYILQSVFLSSVSHAPSETRR